MIDHVTVIFAVQKLAAENGVIQNLQLLCLGTGLILFGRIGWRARGPRRTFAFCGGVATFLAFARELDLRHLEVPQWTIELTSGPLRNIWFSGLICAAPILRDLATPRQRLFLLALAALIASQAFDGVELFADTSDFFVYHYLRLGEELGELLAYVLLAFAAHRMGTALGRQ